MITDDPEAVLEKQKAIKKLPKRIKGVPAVVLSDVVMMPGLTVPVTVETEPDRTAAIVAEQEDKPLFIVCARDAKSDKPRSENIYSIGVLAKILKVIPVSEDSLSVLVTVIGQAEVENVYEIEEPEIMYVDVAQIKEKFPTKTQEEEMDVLLTSIVSLYRKILSLVGDDETEGVVKSMENIDNPLILMHFIIMNSPLDATEKQELLECRSIRDRAKKLLGFLEKAKQFMKIRAEIAKTTQERLTQQQKEHFLRQQIATIEDELGEGPDDDEINELISKSEKKVWGEKVQAHFDKEVRKLERFPPNSPEYGIQYNYLENMLNLPWDQYSEDNFDLKKVRERLDADHYGLEKVKERIVEQMAVLKLRGDMKAPILCFYGPPGVGKTSLGRSIAAAIGREYERVALGGVHDEAEIRGHRRTYIGAMPGRILAALEKVGSGNPVLVLDEVDKISRDMKGDPSTALLEVLDPEQNNKFHDNYLNYDYDLSKVMFIATANDLSTISAPLLDRMELIEVPGYVTDEKLEIATRHLVPKVTKEHGLPEGAFEVSREALTYIIDRYTRESGVRQLEKQLAKLTRKYIVRDMEGKTPDSPISVATVRELLGAELIDPDMYEGNDMAGIVTGLAWTAAGGEILFIEVSLVPGKGKLTLTGQLGDVMKESATIALEYLKAHAEMLNIDSKLFDCYDIHLHVPQGAIPKDGPSAGITITTALTSAFTRRKVMPELAMTGEITLRGKVLPVGGIKEKILAASRAGIKTIILCEQNRRDIEEINPDYVKHLTFHYVKRIDEVLALALTDEIDTTLPELKVAAPKKAEQ